MCHSCRGFPRRGTLQQKEEEFGYESGKGASWAQCLGNPRTQHLASPEMLRTVATTLALSLAWSCLGLLPASAQPEPAPTPPEVPAQEALPSGALFRLGSLDPDASSEQGHRAGVYFVVFSPDGKRLVSRGMDYTIRVWDLEHPPQHLRLEAGKPVALSPDGKWLAAGTNGSVAIWSFPQGKQQHTLPTAAELLHFPSPQRLLVLAHGVLTWYDPAQGRKAGKDMLIRLAVPLAVSAEGKHLAYLISQYNHNVQVTSLDQQRSTRTFTGKRNRPICAAFSPGATLLACGGRDRLTHVWEIATGRLLYTLEGHQGPVQAVTFSPDGSLLATASWDTTVVLWETATGRPVATLRGHRRHVAAVAFSPDGKRLATGSTDRTILVWDLARVLLKQTPKPIPLTQQELEQLWQQLASDDAAQAYAAIGRMIAGGETTTQFVRRQLASLLEADQLQRVEELIAQLDAPQYMVRERATRQLMQLLAIARARLQEELEKTLSAEVRFRIRKLLALQAPKPVYSSPQRHRLLRLVQVLKQIDSEESRRLLQLMARRVPDPRVMKEARRALEQAAVPSGAPDGSE